MRDEIIEKRGYDKSVHGDKLSLEIASYPITASYLAERLAKNGKTICELCCGIGISLIEYSRCFDKVIGIDNDLHVIESARDNLSTANVKNYDLIVGDVSIPDILSKITADIVAYDIPYWSDHNGQISAKNPNLTRIIELIQSNITPNIVIYAPPYMSTEDFTQLADNFEYQEVWIDGKHDRNFVYLGGLVSTPGLRKLELSNY